MGKIDQSKTPFIDAISSYVGDDVAPFDVPGHHMGNIKHAATELFGTDLFKKDINAPIGLDNLAHPSGVLLESERLMAEAFGADDAFFLINGTSSGIMAMIMTTVKAGEKIILPRNVHKSVINALILSGAIPVYVMPKIDKDLEIANHPTIDDWKKAMDRNPSAKAIFVINPTYFGSVCDLKTLVKMAHDKGMAVLVDEAHGAHYYFKTRKHPVSAMEGGADMSAVSIHKTAGSLTQSSALLIKGKRFARDDVQASLNILNSTSPSPILMASLDGARAYIASQEGVAAMENAYRLCEYAEEEISKIPGFKVDAREHFMERGSFDYDPTKLVIELDRLDIDGFGLYRLLKTGYGVQMELAETYAVLGIIAVGTKKRHIDKLVAALKEISKEHFKPETSYPNHRFDAAFPFMLARPRTVFNAPGKIVSLEECVGAISREQVMIYPPGIPLIVPGEVWSKDLVERVRRYQATGVTMISSHADGFEVIDIASWRRYFMYEKKLTDYKNNRKTTPYSDGYVWPFEGEEHECTLMLMPFRRDTWRMNAKPGQESYLEVIKAIAEHEPVVVGVLPPHFKEMKDKLSSLSNVTPISIRYNDAWARDNMPLFVTKKGNVRTVDFRFNAWGGEVDGLYSNYKDDDRISSLISKRLGLQSYYEEEFVLEGGSVATDGEGTIITTEACLLSKGRNPLLTKKEIEEKLQEFLSAEKIIWVPHGIYGDETNEHIDNMVSFVRPGEVVMAWSEDKDDPQYAYCQETYKALLEAEDAKGRKLIIHKLPLPSKPLYMSKEEASTLRADKTTIDERVEGRRLAASYVNYYQGKDFIVMPGFGIKEDKEAKSIIQSLYPKKTIHQINTREILLGGGNIHCITMQIPKKGESK